MGLMVLFVLVLAVGIGAAAFSSRRRGAQLPGQAQQSAQSAQDAEAEAHRWVDRLGGGLSTLRADENPAAAQALADATERHRAAQGQLATAWSPAQYALVTQTAVEGLHYVRAARTALGLDPGPALPELGAGAGQLGQGGRITVGGQEYTASPRPGASTPYYYPGGVVAGRTVPGGWYSSPWWKTALVAGAAGVGGMLLVDALLDGFHGGPHGGPHGPGGFGGGFGGFGGGPGGPF